MKKTSLKFSMLASSLLLLFVSTFASSPSLVQKAISQDPTISDPAIAELRSMGPKGMAIFLAEHGQGLQSADLAVRKDLRTKLDRIAGQYDSFYSGLYWYTDIDQAKARALQSDKPILSLRMLGQLTDNLSCANSRMFRAVLYANQKVAAFMKDNFVLHWSSERPVPKVSIDFGDGRKLETTITGNSIHYVLDPSGKPLDGIPGLYGPEPFIAQLENALNLYNAYSVEKKENQPAFLQSHHQTSYEELDFLAAEYKYKIENPTRLDLSAFDAQFRTMSKARIELPVLAEIVALPIDEENLNTWKMDFIADQRKLRLMAEQLRMEIKLDSSSIQLMKDKIPVKYANQQKLEQDVEALELRVLFESAQNEIGIHSVIHDMFSQKLVTNDFVSLNRVVYDQLFMTRKSDPWMGLLPADVFTGLDNDGIQN